MASAFFDRLFGLAAAPAASPGLGMSSTLLNAAHVGAWYRRHRESDILHLAYTLYGLSDVERLFAARGIDSDDVEGVVLQLFEELPEVDDDEKPPTRSTRLQMVAQAATRMNVMTTSRLLEALADALPPELAFVRAPTRACADPIGTMFDAKVGTKGTDITLENWDDDLKKCFGLLQHLSDDRWPTWNLSPPTLFITMLCYKPYFASFSARGVDPKQIVRDIGEAVGKAPPRLARPRPKALTPSLSAGLYALVLRAERYAAEDASDVRLRHVLAALHDEKELAPLVDRLAG